MGKLPMGSPESSTGTITRSLQGPSKVILQLRTQGLFQFLGRVVHVLSMDESMVWGQNMSMWMVGKLEKCPLSTGALCRIQPVSIGNHVEVWAKMRQKCYQPCCRLFAYLAEESRETAQPTGNHSPENNKIRIRKTQQTSKPNKNKYKYKYTRKNKNLICPKLHPPHLAGPHGSFWETTKCTPPVFGYCHDIEKEDEGGQTYLPRKKLRFSFSAFTSPKKCKIYSAIGLYSKMDLSKCVFNYCFFKNNIKISPWWWFIRDVSLVQSSRQGHKHIVSLPQTLAHMSIHTRLQLTRNDATVPQAASHASTYSCQWSGMGQSAPR